MSASNWCACPRCKKNAEAEHAEAIRAANDAYGKVPAKEFADLVRAANQTPPAKETLREDWELGICDDGEFFVRYSGACQECGFSHEFDHEEQLSLDETPGS